MGSTLEDLTWENRAVRSMPLDPNPANAVRAVLGAVFSRVVPTPLARPALVCVSKPALALLGLAPSEAARPEFAAVFAGNQVLPGCEPVAHCYAGYQFGSFAGQLGDGAAILLGEVRTPVGERWEVQLKGAGLTPYSRTADGRKVLRSSLREFLASEAHAALGIPTTRAATLVTSDSSVVRDPHYSGQPVPERCSVVSRLAPTFLRFGSFQIALGRDPQTGQTGPSPGRYDLLKELVDFTIATYFPEVAAAHAGDTPAAFAARLTAFHATVCTRTARLVASWQCFAWCHGVLNTDNMSILGLTLDYGPYGWMERFDPGYVCNTSDNSGRYRYEAQPQVCMWNCVKLGEALAPLLTLYGGAEGGEEAAMDASFGPALTAFGRDYTSAYNDGMRRKLGLGLGQTAEGLVPSHPLWACSPSLPSSAADTPSGPGGLSEVDAALLTALLEAMEKTGADWTATWRALGVVPLLPPADGGEGSPALTALLDACASAAVMAEASKPRVPLARLEAIRAFALANPTARPDLTAQLPEIEAELAKAAAYPALQARTEAAKRQEDAAVWSAWLARYAARLQREVPPGASAAEAEALARAREAMQESANPRFVLRNWMAQAAIDAAERGNYPAVQSFADAMGEPFGRGGGTAEAEAAVLLSAAAGGDALCLTSMRAPAWARSLQVSCSS
jgi:uncharacterized protein YdiU (UPF0061 family)